MISERKAELIDWIVNNVTDWNDKPEYTREYLEKASGERLLGIFLEWEGIQGYTNLIIETIEQAFDVDLTNRKFLE